MDILSDFFSSGGEQVVYLLLLHHHVISRRGFLSLMYRTWVWGERMIFGSGLKFPQIRYMFFQGSTADDLMI